VRHLAASTSAAALAVEVVDGGRVVLIGQYAGTFGEHATPPRQRAVAFLAMLDLDAGGVEWVVPFGSSSPRHTRGEATLAERREIWKQTDSPSGESGISLERIAATYRVKGALTAELDDGVIVGGAEYGLGEPLGVVERAPRLWSVRWTRMEPVPTSLIADSLGRVIAVGGAADDLRVDGKHVDPYLVAAIAAADGTTIWTTPLETELDSPHHVVEELDGELVVVATSDEGPLYDSVERSVPSTLAEVHRIAIDGEILGTATLTAGTDAAAPTYVIRGTGDDRELVKLGPCPVGGCSLEAR
jgi:hypothetical protein